MAGTTERTLVQAVNDALREGMRRDPSVLVLGEDIGRAGGVFRATEGLLAEFGPERVVDTPLAEAVPRYFLYFSSIAFMRSAADVPVPFRISCIISVDGGRMWFARR